MTMKDMKCDINTIIAGAVIDTADAAALSSVCTDNNATYKPATATAAARVAWTRAARKNNVAAVYEYIMSVYGVDAIATATDAETDNATAETDNATETATAETAAARIDYTVSYTVDGITRACVVRATDAETARAYFNADTPAAVISGVSVDTCNLPGRGCPVLIVPDNWTPATDADATAPATADATADATDADAANADATDADATAPAGYDAAAAARRYYDAIGRAAAREMDARAAAEKARAARAADAARAENDKRAADAAAAVQSACTSYAARAAARTLDAARRVRGNDETAAAAAETAAAETAAAETAARAAAVETDKRAAAAENARRCALKDAKKARKDARAETLERKGADAAAAVIDDIFNFAALLSSLDNTRLTPAARARLYAHKVEHAAARAYNIAADKGGKRPRRRYYIVTALDAASDTSADAPGKVRAVADTVTDTAIAVIDSHAGKIAWQALRTCERNMKETRRGAPEVYVDARGNVLDAPRYSDQYSSLPYTSDVLNQAPLYSAYERRRAAAETADVRASDVIQHKYTMQDSVVYIASNGYTTTKSGRKPYCYTASMDAAAAYTAPAVYDTYSGFDVNLYVSQVVEGATPAAAYLTEWHTPALYKTKRTRARIENKWVEVVGTTAGNARAENVLDTLPDYADVKQTALCAFYQLVHDGALSNLSDIRAFDKLVYARVNAYIQAQARAAAAAEYDTAPDFYARASAAADGRADKNGADYNAETDLCNVATNDALKSAINAISAEYDAETARVLYYLAQGRKVREIANMNDVQYGKSWVHKRVKVIRAWLINHKDVFTDIFGVSPAAIRY